jgi:5-methylcytosine-specific restriction protein B
MPALPNFLNLTILNLPDEVVNETRGKTAVKKFDNEVAFARNYLVMRGT